MSEECVCCGKVIPEGSQVCVICGFALRKNEPEYMKNIKLSYPTIEESMFGEAKLIHKSAIEIAESFDNAIQEKIIDIAKEKGFNSLLLLNKKDIAKALEKQIPKKPELLRSFYPESLYRCPSCPTKVRQFERFSTSYCPHCGQALDWGDTE